MTWHTKVRLKSGSKRLGLTFLHAWRVAHALHSTAIFLVSTSFGRQSILDSHIPRSEAIRNQSNVFSSYSWNVVVLPTLTDFYQLPHKNQLGINQPLYIHIDIVTEWFQLTSCIFLQFKPPQILGEHLIFSIVSMQSKWLMDLACDDADRKQTL